MISLAFMNDDILVESSYAKMEVISSCYEGLEEGVDDGFLVNIASSYTRSMIYEILENVKDKLLALYQKVLSALNNFALNHANLADKYRNLIIDRYVTMSEPFIYRTYEYPKLKSKFYPNITYSVNTLTATIEELQTAVIEKGMTDAEVGFEVDKIIVDFGRGVIDGTVNPDDVKDTAYVIALDHLRGQQVTRKLEQRDINAFIDEIKTYKPLKDDINKTKTTIIKEYENLKRVYTKAMEEKASQSLGIKSLKQPEIEGFKVHEVQRFTDINLQMTRMFNAFITIYNEAFNTKLQVIQDRIEDNRKILVELMGRTGVLAAINAKTPAQKKRPLVFDPKLIT